MNSEEIETAGVWLLRLTLVAGAVAAALLNQPDIACQLALALIVSFFLL